MIIKNSWHYDVSIKLDTTKIEQLKKIFEKYYNIRKYTAKLSDKRTVEFDSFEELLGYENYKERRIISLEILGYGENDINSSFVINISPTLGERKNIFHTFGRTINLTYNIKDIERSRNMEAELTEWANSCNTKYHLIAKLNLYYLFWLFCALHSFLASPLHLAKDGVELLFSMNLFVLIVLFFVVSLFYKLIDFIDKKFITQLLTPIVFYWGEEIEREDRRDKLRSNLLWCVFVAAIVALFVNFIS